jgi:hypothetical protein
VFFKHQWYINTIIISHQHIASASTHQRTNAPTHQDTITSTHQHTNTEPDQPNQDNQHINTEHNQPSQLNYVMTPLSISQTHHRV